MFVSFFAYPIQDTSGTGERGSSVDTAKHIQPLVPPHLSSKGSVLYLLFLNHFPPWKQLNLHRISPCSSGHGALTKHTTPNCSAGKPEHRQSTSPVSQRTQYHKKRVCSALFFPGSSLRVGASATFLPLQGAHVWVKDIYSTFLSLLVRQQIIQSV